MYQTLRPLLFRLDPEDAHHLTLGAAQLVGRAAGLLPAPAPHPALGQTLWGQHFSSPLGLAAGLLKNAEALPVFSRLGFGFLEVGTVTPLAQEGNPRPRLFRLPEDGALINRMGFNNGGLPPLRRRIQDYSGSAVLWANIGKNKDTPAEEAQRDYRTLVRGLAPYASGLVVNVSSPNTPGLRALQAADDLHALLSGVLAEAEASRVRARHAARPVLVKLSPDMEEAALLASLEAAQSAGVSGVILTNTTLSRTAADGGALASAHAAQAGGLSGRPLRERSLLQVRLAAQHTSLPIVAVGGMFTAQHVYEALCAGASLAEVYTALIYEGPELVGRINTGLLRLLESDGFSSLSQAVGSRL